VYDALFCGPSAVWPLQPGTAPSLSMQGRITELDGVRAIAVGLVFLNHFAPTKTAPWLDLPRNLGWVGVDIFFVLSGFLVTSILLKAAGNREGYFRNFYARRTLRIFPLYYLLLTASLSIMLAAKGGAPLRDMQLSWGSPLWLYAYLGNVRTAVTNVSPPDYFVPMWSLHVEEQFYLVLPPLVLYLTRAHLKQVLIGAIILAPAIRGVLDWAYPDLPLLQFMLFPCRMDSLALGGLLAVVQTSQDTLKRWRWPLVVATAVTLLVAIETFRLGGGTFDGHVERTIGYSLFALACLAFIMSVLSLRGTAATAWLNWRPLQYVGMISYGFYLLQYPANGLFNRTAHLMGLSTAALEDTLVKFVCVGAICLALSSISWYLWETRWLAAQRQFRRPPTPAPTFDLVQPAR
jgi:peptidoglycan/LPS O-acetylase OafA/YrhL